VVSPETYERYLELVRVIVDELHVIDTSAQLLEADRSAEAIARRAVAGSELVSDGLDLRLAAGAAFAVRSRRLAVEERRNDAERRVRAARERADAWVVIEETGDGVLTPYRRVEMHLPDGAGLICTVEADLEGGPTVYRAQVVELDPTTGRGVDRPEKAGEPLTFSERRQWREAISDLMSRIESPS
jgi:hypothetical protein